MININTRIALSGLSILASLALMGGAAFALFSSTGTSTGNVFGSGTLILQLDDDDESTPSASVTASFGGSNLAPDATASGFLSVHNDGTIDMAEIKLGANQTGNSDNGDGSNLADVLNMTVKTGSNSDCSNGMSDHTSTIAGAIGDQGSPLTLTELNTTDYDSLPGLTAGSGEFLCMDFTMDHNAGNNYQGDSITETFVLEGHQNLSQ